MSFVGTIIKSMLDSSTRDSITPADLPRVPIGELKCRISGFGYQTALKAKLYGRYGNKPTLFSLTPPNKYQESQGWPETPFVNINLAGSKTTTKSNWLGYLRTNYYGEIDLPNILERHGSISVYGKITKSGNDFNVDLLLPNNIDPLEVSVQLEDDALRKMTQVATETSEGFVYTSLQKIAAPKGEIYHVIYDSTHIGNISAKKTIELDSWLAGRSIISARLGIATFRYNEHPHYTKLAITPDITE